MLIILEGCDGVGKTTLANMLKNTLDDAEIIHCNVDTPNTYDFFKRIVQAAGKKNIIADRFCYGQFVYEEEEDRPLTYMNEDSGDVYDNPYHGLHKLESYMIDLPYSVKLVYVYCDPETAAQRIIERDGDDFEEVGGITRLDTIKAVMQGYENLWTKTLLRPIYYRT